MWRVDGEMCWNAGRNYGGTVEQEGGRLEVETWNNETGGGEKEGLRNDFAICWSGEWF